jgi:endo-1,4-beta-xylanase
MAFKSLALLSLTAVPALAADGLNTRAKAAGKLYFGTATDNGELTDSAYLAQLSNTSDFGQLTPGNSQKVGRAGA